MDRSRELNILLLPGYALKDIPRLAMLTQARELIEAFTGVFRGTDEDVILRLYVLLAMAEQTGSAEWTPPSLQSALSFVEPFKMNTTIARLSECGLIAYEATPGVYRLTALAFLVLAAWTSVMQFADERFGEFAFLNAQIAGGAETIGVSEEILSLALARTRDIHRIVAHHSHYLRPRWEDLPLFWRHLLTAAQYDDNAALHQVHLHGLQLLGKRD